MLSNSKCPELATLIQHHDDPLMVGNQTASQRCTSWILYPQTFGLVPAAYMQDRATILAGRSRNELFSSTATEVLGCSWEIDSSAVHVCYLPAPLETSEMLHYGLQATYRGRASGRGPANVHQVLPQRFPHVPQRCTAATCFAIPQRVLGGSLS